MSSAGEAAAASAPPRLAGVEGLRAIAAGMVLASHAWYWMGATGTTVDLGWLSRWIMPHLSAGVALFFCLSGFLLYRPFAIALLEDRPFPSVRRYLRNRALRILPAYWVILFVVAVVLRVAFVRHGHDVVLGGVGPALFLQDAALLQDLRRSTVITGIGPAWSLAVEAQFYLLLPLLGLAAMRLARPRRPAPEAGVWRRRLALLAPVAMMACIGVAARASSRFVPFTGDPNFGDNWHAILRLSLFCSADLFAWGMLLAILRAEAELGRLRIRGWQWALAAVAAMGAVGVAMKLQRAGHLSPQVQFALFAPAFTWLIATVVLARRQIVSRVLETRAIALVGLVSYSLFLWNQPVALLLHREGLDAGGGRSGYLANVLLLFGISLAAATITYRFVERPALMRRRPTPTRSNPVRAAEQTATVQAAP